ncbi:MAG: peptide deformylase [Planctomycetota bacterium]
MDHADHVIRYPDPRLRRKAEPVGELTPELKARIEAMFPLMYRSKGIGLAAPQLGWNVRLFVMNLTGEPKDELALVDPEIVEEGGGTWVLEEGCLSLPGIYGKVKRDKRVVMRGRDLDGEQVQVEAEGMVARCMLHEFDHLDGILFIDRLSPVKKQSIKRRLRTLEEEFADERTEAPVSR